MDVSETHRLGSRMLAIDIRLAELRQELQRTQIRVHHLEAQLEDARLARLVGSNDQAIGDPDAITPELEHSRSALQAQQEFINGVRAQLRKARAEYMMARVQERRAAKALETLVSVPPDSSQAPSG